MIHYQLERTTATDVNDKSTYVVSNVGKPVRDLKLAKAKLALECMRDERLGIPAKYRIIKIEA